MDWRELIDTWWDVNEQKNVTHLKKLLELIDTWWDVNEQWRTSGTLGILELIDTWWDVNMVPNALVRANLRINRYIVGCKYFHKLLIEVTDAELIDT